MIPDVLLLLSKMSENLRKVCNDAVKRRKTRGKKTLGRTTEFVMIDENNLPQTKGVYETCSLTCEPLGPLPPRKQINEVTFWEPIGRSKQYLINKFY